MKKKCLANSACPLSRAYNVIGDWWSLLIITQIMITKVGRFSDIQTNLGMAKNILTARLKKLVEDGILDRVPASDGGAHHEYVLTDLGRDLYKVVVALRQWGERHYFDRGGCDVQLVDGKKKRSLPEIELRSADGRVLGPDDFELAPRKSSKV
ncbi:MAG TPA: helix-turn-helix domain-containing protein [Tepidisphaeraceae bacterium]|nr:helix-turn-helix domain-containing protein [Tepidisphaeraceae bacterium]